MAKFLYCRIFQKTVSNRNYFTFILPSPNPTHLKLIVQPRVRHQGTGSVFRRKLVYIVSRTPFPCLPRLFSSGVTETCLGRKECGVIPDPIQPLVRCWNGNSSSWLSLFLQWRENRDACVLLGLSSAAAAVGTTTGRGWTHTQTPPPTSREWWAQYGVFKVPWR